MKIDIKPLGILAPGVTPSLTLHHFGDPGLGPKTYIQGGLHADEAPGMLVAARLCTILGDLERQRRIHGHIVVVPAANPIGLSQFLLGDHLGRFGLADGVNFNRQYPDIADEVVAALAGKLSQDTAANNALIRATLRRCIKEKPARRPVDILRSTLLSEAIDADLVLDLHCDSEGVMHLYCLPDQVAALTPLSALLGCKAMLTAEISGENPFDEAASRPWQAIRAAYPDYPIPEAGIATTVELRGEQDVTSDFAEADCAAILGFLAHRGQIDMAPPALPPLACTPTPLAGSETVRAAAAGILAFIAPVGATVSKGERIAEIVDPASGMITPVEAGTAGLLFARTSGRVVQIGSRIGNIAGSKAFRSGNLLGA